MTNRDFFNLISANETLPSYLREHADNELAKLDKRNAARSSKPSKTQLANEPIKAAILEWLSTQTEPVTASVVGEAHGISVQKASSLLRGLVEENKLTQSEVKVPKKGTQKAYAIKEEVGE